MPEDASPPGRHDLTAWFEGYLRVCNRHAFDELVHFVAEDVVANGQHHGRTGYADGLRTVARGFPDYRWTLQQLVINNGWLAAHYLVSGTHLGTFLGVRPTGRRVRADEYAFYRVEDFLITEYRGTADQLTLLSQLRAGQG